MSCFPKNELAEYLFVTIQRENFYRAALSCRGEVARMRGTLASLAALAALAAAVVTGSNDQQPRSVAEMTSEVQELRSSVQELRRSVLLAIERDSNSDPTKAAAPGRRRLQTSGEGETVNIHWDGESLNIQSSVAGKSTKVSMLGDLNITGDLYLNGILKKETDMPSPVPTAVPIPAPTAVPIAAPTTFADRCGASYSETSWTFGTAAGSSTTTTTTASTTYCSDCHPSYHQYNSLDGNQGTQCLIYVTAGYGWLAYDLGSSTTINGVQIANGQGAYGVQGTLLQSATSISGPWTTQATFTVTNTEFGGAQGVNSGGDYVLLRTD